MKKVLISLILLAIAAVNTVAQNMADQIVPMDEAVRKGTLPNGLTYYIRHNEWPEKRAFFYIAQKVGSIQENDDQRGLAHFLEHMCFNGTKNFPGDKLKTYLEGIGVRFGENLNAYTSFDETVYNIDNVNVEIEGAVDNCLLILHDWSHDLLLEDKEIDKERGVIHAEWAMRNSGQMRLITNMLPSLYPDSRWGTRMPIGTMEVVDNFPYEALRTYYKKWYRPDNQAIIVVGDVDVDHTEQMIRQMFSPIAMQPNAPKVEKIPVADNNTPIYLVDKDKELKGSSISLCMKHEAFPDEAKNTEAYFVRSYINSLFGSILNARYSELSQKAECSYLSAGAGIGEYFLSNTKGALSLDVTPKENKDLEAFREAVRELMRVRQHGFTAGEFKRAQINFMSYVEKAYANRDKRHNDQFGDECRDNFLSNEPIIDIDTEVEIWKKVEKMVTLDRLNAAAKSIISLSDTNLVVFEFAQDKEGIIVPTAEQLRKTYEAARNEKLDPWQDNSKDEPLIAQLPKKGSIKKVTENKTLGYKELTLSNGATVILKKTDYKADEIILSATSNHGTSEYGEKDFANIKILGSISGISALGNFTMTELNKALAGKQCGVG